MEGGIGRGVLGGDTGRRVRAGGAPPPRAGVCLRPSHRAGTAGVHRAGVFPMKRNRGAALVEFALTALILYLLVAGGVELGHMIYVSQVLQDAARLAARELSVTPIDATFPLDQALADDSVRKAVYDSSLLVIQIPTNCGSSGQSGPSPNDFDTFWSWLPPVNRVLRPIFITETVDLGEGPTRLLRYPGAVLKVSPPVP